MTATLENYWSPAQIRLYLDGYWIDDAQMVMYRVSDQKFPKYGYWDRSYRTVAVGQTIVQGRLTINFRYNGYLRAAIEKQTARRRDHDLMERGKDFRLPRGAVDGQALNNMTDAERLEWVIKAAAAVAPEDRDKTFGFLKNRFWKLDAPFGEYDQNPKDYREDPARMAANVEERAGNRPGLFTDGFDIQMVWGSDPTNRVDPGLTRIIRDVHVAEEAMVCSIEVPDGSRPIVEIYDFIARDVVAGTGTVQHGSGGASGVMVMAPDT